MSARRDMWSRRRDAVRAETRAHERARAGAAADRERAALEEKTDAEILQELDLRDPHEMQAGDDFSAFMKSAVPDRLRRRALRKLWLTNPLLAGVDELVEYGEDFTDASTVIEGLQTAYQVGSGMLKHVRELEKQAEKAAAELESAAPGGGNAPEQKVELSGHARTMHTDDGVDDADNNREYLEAEIHEAEAIDGVEPEFPTALPARDAVPAGVDAVPAGVDAVPAGVDAVPAGVVRRKMRFEFAD